MFTLTPETKSRAQYAREATMGNHDAGRAMGTMAVGLLKMRTTQRALELLDEICEPWRGCDPEFESEDPNNRGQTHPDYTHYTDPHGPMGRLIVEAFGDPGRDYTAGWPDDGVVDAWWDGPRKAFTARYGFW